MGRERSGASSMLLKKEKWVKRYGLWHPVRDGQLYGMPWTTVVSYERHSRLFQASVSGWTWARKCFSEGQAISGLTAIMPRCSLRLRCSMPFAWSSADTRPSLCRGLVSFVLGAGLRNRAMCGGSRTYTAQKPMTLVPSGTGGRAEPLYGARRRHGRHDTGASLTL
jgi:hypothetical protein